MEKTSPRYEVCLAGSGGQGMILAGIILAEAAAIYDDLNAVQTQSYGPAARGGASRTEIIISTEVIHYPKIIKANLLLTMSQEACDKYFFDLRPDGQLVVDTEFVSRIPSSSAIALPITQIARKVTGKAITANIVALGVIGGASGIVSKKALIDAVTSRAPKDTVEINLKALEAGWNSVVTAEPSSAT
ncbi:MAG: 2-oxoacid:acceptor oxidoreductase family protein [Chloroflexota bacterium]